VRKPTKELEERLARMETLIQATNSETISRHDREQTHYGQPLEPGETLFPQGDMESSTTEDIPQRLHLSQSRIAVDLDGTSRRQFESTDDGISRNTAVEDVFRPPPQMAPASTAGFGSCSETTPNSTSFSQATTKALGGISDQENVRLPYHLLNNYDSAQLILLSSPTWNITVRKGC
jgi:hypothetical protein